MKMEDMILISVDDHIVEPATVFDRHTPAKYKDKMPRIIKGPNGEDVWTFEGRIVPNIALNGVAGRRPEEYGFEPTAYTQLRKGTYDVDARIDDMNANGVLASLNFPSFVGVGGQMVEKAQDKDLGYAVVQAWNDWHIDEWCGKYPGRFIPLAIVPNWDPLRAAEEVRRVAKKGCHAISFPPNPTVTGLPSLQSPTWDPLWQACAEEGVTICLHIADSSGGVPSYDCPVDVFITTMPVSLYACAADLIWSPILRKYPEIRFALSEGGTGWIPHFLEKIDYTYECHHKWTHQDFGNRKPSEVFLEHVYTCFIHDPIGVHIRHRAGLKNMSWECDYPHSETPWPRGPEKLWPQVKDIPENEINLITHENAMRAYKFDPFKHFRREDCTVGALRAKATHVDLSYLKTDGAGAAPADHQGVVTFGDIARQLAAVIPVRDKQTTAS